MSFQAISAAVNTVTSSIGTSLLSKREDITKSVETSLNTLGMEVERKQRVKRSLSLGLIENQGIRNSLSQQLEKTLRKDFKIKTYRLFNPPLRILN